MPVGAIRSDALVDKINQGTAGKAASKIERGQVRVNWRAHSTQLLVENLLNTLFVRRRRLGLCIGLLLDLKTGTAATFDALRRVGVPSVPDESASDDTAYRKAARRVSRKRK